MWPRHRPVMLTSRQPANIPTQRHGAVGSLAVYREEEVTQTLSHAYRIGPGGCGYLVPGRRRIVLAIHLRLHTYWAGRGRRGWNS